MTIKETRTLSAWDLRNLCAKRNWYTQGTNEDYDCLLSSLRDSDYEPVEITTEKLAEIAADILRHSDMPVDYDLCCVMFEVAKVCDTCFTME